MAHKQSGLESVIEQLREVMGNPWTRQWLRLRQYLLRSKRSKMSLL
jgi:hypothetical protein